MTSSEFRAKARQSLTGKWGKAALLTLIFSVLTYIINYVVNKILPGIGSLAYAVIAPALSFGLTISFMKLKRGEEVGYVDFFKDGFDNFGTAWGVIWNTILKMVLPVILEVVLLFVVFGVNLYAVNTGKGGAWILSFIVSIAYMAVSIWVTCRGYYYKLATYIAIDNPTMSTKEAVEKSAELMKGHRWQLFWLALTFIGWAILACITLGIGYFWLMPYMLVAEIEFYEYLAGTPENTVKEEITSEPIQ